MGMASSPGTLPSFICLIAMLTSASEKMSVSMLEFAMIDVIEKLYTVIYYFSFITCITNLIHYYYCMGFVIQLNIYYSMSTCIQMCLLQSYNFLSIAAVTLALKCSTGGPLGEMHCCRCSTHAFEFLTLFYFYL